MLKTWGGLFDPKTTISLNKQKRSQSTGNSILAEYL